MVALRPDTVRFGAASDFVSAAEAMERDFALIRARPPLGFAWVASDLNQDGAASEAAEASPAKDKAAAEHGAARFLTLFADVCGFDLARLGERPLGTAELKAWRRSRETSSKILRNSWQP